MFTHLHIYVTECIVCVQGHDPLTFSFLTSSLFFLISVYLKCQNLSEVLKLTRWARRVLFPAVYLQKQVVF